MISRLLTRLWHRPVVRGLSTMALMRYSIKVFSLIRLALVAQFLDPAALGSFGLALLIIAVTEIFTETGINVFLLKSPQKLEEYIDTAWGVSLIRGAIISLSIVLLSPFLAQFYREPSLQLLLFVAALIPFVRGFINPAIIGFQQRLEFEKESLMRVVLQSFDMIVGCALAWWWQSSVGLLVGVLAAVVLELFFSFWLFSLWPNLRSFRISLVKKLYKETRMIIGNGIVNYLSENIDYLIIGRVLGTAGLGLYQTGFKIAGSVTIDMGSSMGQTLYPVYAQLHTEGKPVTPLWRKSTGALIMLYLFLAIPLIFFTDPLIHFVFRREAWLEVIPLIRVLFVAGALKSFLTSWNPLSILAGNLSHHILIHILTMVVVVCGILVWAPQYGVVGAGWAILVALAFVQPYAWFVVRQALRRVDGKR